MVKKKALNLLKDGKPHSRYEIWEYVLSWGRYYLQQSMDRPLQQLEKDGVLKSKVIDGKKYYKINEAVSQ